MQLQEPLAAVPRVPRDREAGAQGLGVLRHCGNGCFVSPVTVVVLSAVQGTASRVDWEWAFPGHLCFAGRGRAGGPELPLQWERGERFEENIAAPPALAARDN